MKLSLILVSVNIAATLPIAAATVASAQEAKGDTANWMKSSLASLDQTTTKKSKTIRARNRSFSAPMPDTSGRSSLTAGGMRLRPFVPGRKLPRQRDLDMELISQTARMAAQPEAQPLSAQVPQMATASAPLSGQVSSEAYDAADAPRPANAWSNVATYGSVGYVRQTSSRVAPGQSPAAIPGQIRQFRPSRRRAVPAFQQQPVNQQLPAPQVARQAEPQAPRPLQPVFFQPTTSVMQPVQVEPPPMSPDEQVIIDRMVQNAQTHPFEDNFKTGANTMSSAGPAPFPLNLLPQDSLKQLIAGGRARGRSETPPAFFGSWHGSSLANLPAAGFHSHLQGREPRYSNFSRYAPVSRPTASMPRSREERPMSQLRRLPPHEIKVAAYPPYPRMAGAVSY